MTPVKRVWCPPKSTKPATAEPVRSENWKRGRSKPKVKKYLWKAALYVGLAAIF